jgi:nucleoside-diphosphate-sugar epimerase
VVFDYVRLYGISASVIQPTVVYGPGAPAWTCGPILKLSRGKMILVNNGDGLCNAVYVDDVIQAMILAAVRKEAVGEAFLVSARRPVTWKEFFGFYEKMIGSAATVPMAADEAERYLKKSRKDQNPVRLALRLPGEIGAAFTKHPGLIRDLVSSPATACLTARCRPLLPQSLRVHGQTLVSGRRRPDPGVPVCRDLPVMPLSEEEIRYYQAKTEVSIDKAQQLLGYVPVFGLAEGMDLTARWLEFAGFGGDHDRS